MRKWLENYWYHYKWHTLIVLFFAVSLTIMGIQMCSRDEHDIHIIYAGPNIISEEKHGKIEEAFSQLMPRDYDEDGVKSIDFMDLILMDSEEMKKAYDNNVSQYFLNEATVEQAKETLSVQAMAGDYVIFLIDKDWYADLHKAGAFQPFEQLTSLGITLPEGARKYDECAYYLNSLDFAKFFNCFDDFPADTLFCIRRMSTTTVTTKRNEEIKLMYDRHLDYYNSVVGFKLPEGWVEQ